MQRVVLLLLSHVSIYDEYLKGWYTWEPGVLGRLLEFEDFKTLKTVALPTEHHAL